MSDMGMKTLRGMRSCMAEASVAETDAAWERMRAGTRKPKPDRRRRLMVAAAGAAVVVGLGIGIPTLLPSDPVVSSAAAAVLIDAADRASAQTPPQVAGPGQFVYTRSLIARRTIAQMTDGTNIAQDVRTSREIWTNVDGGGRLVERCLETRFATPADRERWIAAGRPADIGTECPPAPQITPLDGPALYADGLTRAQFLALPTDTDELYDYIYAAGLRWAAGDPARAPETEMFEIVGYLLRETDAPPALRAAVLRVAARIHGVTLLGDERDPAGRLGTGVAYESEGRSSQLIIDTQTGRLLGERTEATSEPPPNTSAPGTTGTPPKSVGGYDQSFSAAYITNGIVDEIGVRP